MFAKYPGQLIERQYNPFVNNPKSAAQTEQRAKLKLASQLSAVLGKRELIGFPSAKMVSSRNAFVADLFNRSVLGYSNSKATANLALVRLTGSKVEMLQSMTAVRNNDSLEINLGLLPIYVGQVLAARVVVLTSKYDSTENVSDLSIKYAADLVFNGANTSVTVNGISATHGYAVYAYVYKPADERTYTKFKSIVTNTDSNIAELDVVRTSTTSSLQYSVTSAVMIPIQ